MSQQQQQQQQQKQFQVEVIDIYEQKEKSKKKHSKHASYLRDVNSNSLQRKSRLISKKVPVVLICTYSALKISVEIEVQDFGNKCLAINLCAFCTRDFQSLKPEDENYPRLRQAESSSRKDTSDASSSFSAHSSGNFSFNSFSTTPATSSMTPASGAAIASGSVNMGSDASNSGSFSNNSQQQQQQQQQQQAPPLSVSCEIIKVQKLETAPGWTRYTFNIPIAHLKDRQFKAPLRLGFEGIYCSPDQNVNDHNVSTFQGWLHALPLMSIYTNAAFFYQDRSYSQAAFSLFSQVLPVRVITDPTYSYFPLYTPDIPSSSSQLSSNNNNSGANPSSGSSSTSSSSEMSSPLCGVSTSASVSSTPMSVDDTLMTSSAHLVGAQTSSTTAGATTSLRGSQTMSDDVLQVIDAVLPKQEPSPLTAKNSPTMTIEVIRFFDMVQIVDAFFQFVAQMDESWSFCLQSEENIQWLLSILSLSQFQQQPSPATQAGSNNNNGSGQTDGVPAFFPTTASVLIYDDPVTGKPIRCFEFADIVQLFSPLHQCAGANPQSSREAKQNYCVLRQVALTISKIPNHIRLGDVLGVLSHRRAHRLLHNQRPGTYLLRISPSRPSSVVITYVRKDCPHEEIAGMTIVSELTDELLDSCVRSISHLINPDQLYLRGAKRFRSSSFMLESYGSHAQILTHSHVHSHGHQLQSSPSHLLPNNHAVPQMISVPSSSANYTSYPTTINIDPHRGQTWYPAMTSPAASPPSSNDFFVPSHFHQNLSALSFDLSNSAVPASPSLVNNGGHNNNNNNNNNGSGQRQSLWNPNLIQIESPLSSLFSYTDVSDSTPSHFLEESGTVFAISHNSSSNLNNSHTPNNNNNQQQHQQQHQQTFGDGGNSQFIGNQQGNKMNFSPAAVPAAAAAAPVPMQVQSGPPAKLIKLVFRFKDQAAPIKVTSDTTFRKVVNELIQMFQWNVQVESLRLYDSDGCLRMFDSLVTEEESEFILHPIS